MRLFSLMFTTFWLAIPALSADWPQFNGPMRNGISSEKGLQDSWPEGGPKQLWEIQVGPGFGGAAIKDGKVYFTDRENDQKDLIRCVDLATGEEVWRMTKEVPGRLPFNGSRCTPTIDGNMVFAVSPFGHFYAIDMASGKLVWEVPFMEKYGGEPPRWGYSHAPLVVGKKVIIAPMSDKANLVAFDRETGKQLWQSAGAGGDGYASPNLFTLFGKPQILMLNKDKLMSVDPENGKELWTYSGYQNPIPIPHPTALPGDRLFISGGYGAGSVMVKVEKNGDEIQVSELFRLDNRGSQVQQVIYHDGYLYANFNTNENLRKEPEGLICLDENGETMWKTNQSPPMNRGNLIIADDKILALGGENGILYMAKATPKGYQEMASANIFETKPRENMIWAPMALTDGKLVLRNQSMMKCLDLK